MSRFRKVLRNRNFFLLWLGQIISQLGDRLDQMALIAFMYLRAPGSTFEIAKMLSFTILPVFLIGPIAGVYVDRWERRRTMYLSDLLRAGLVLSIPLFLFYAKSLLPVYLVIFLVFSIGRFFVPAKLSILPELVEKDDLLIANSLINTTGMIAAILGFGVSGIVVEWLGAKSGFYLDSCSFLISATLIFFIRKEIKVVTKLAEMGREIVQVLRSPTSVLQDIRQGVVYFLRTREIRFTAGIMFVLWSALGSVYAVIIVFVQKTLGSATKDLGLLVMCLGIGLFLGSLLYGRFGSRLSHQITIFSSLILSGAMVVVFSFTVKQHPSFEAAAGLAVALGLVIAPIMTAANTIVHNASDNGMMGKTFSSMEIVMHLGFLLFMFISSILADRFSHFVILVTVGCIVCIVGAVHLLLSRKRVWLH